MKLRLLLLPLLVLAVNSRVALAREWTDVTGKYKVEAEFGGVIAGKVRLKKASGEIVTVPLERLSEADREHIQSLARTGSKRKPHPSQEEPESYEEVDTPKKPERSEETDPLQNTNTQPTRRLGVAAAPADDARTAVPPAGAFALKKLKTVAFPLRLQDLAYSPDGKTLVVVTIDPERFVHKPTYSGGAVELWDAASGRKRGVFLDASALVRCATFSRDGKVLALGGIYGLRLFNTENGKEMTDIKTSPRPGGSFRIRDMAFSPTENMLACVSLDEVDVQLLDLSTGKFQLIPSPLAHSRADSVSFSPDGRTIAMIASQKAGGARCRLWSVADGRELDTTAVSNAPSVTHPGPKRRFVVVGNKEQCAWWFIWDTSTNRAVRVSFGPGSVINLVISPHGRWLVSDSLLPGRKFELCIRDAATGKIMAKLPAPSEWASPIAFSPDGRILAVGEAAETDKTMNLSFYSLYGNISPVSITP